MNSISEIRERIVGELKAAGVSAPDITADALISETLGCDRAYLYSHTKSPVPEERENHIDDWVAQRLDGVPLHRIIGWREFFSLRFQVGPGVFLPRPETETLVETVLECLKDVQRPLICDVGCGAGIVGLTLALERPDARVVLLDTFQEPLDLTLHNATLLGVLDRVTVLKSDLLSTFREGIFDGEYQTHKTGSIEEIQLSLEAGEEETAAAGETDAYGRKIEKPKPIEDVTRVTFDAVVSNPPYVESGVIDTLDTEVKDYDPHPAPDGGPDGTGFHQRLLAETAGLADRSNSEGKGHITEVSLTSDREWVTAAQSFLKPGGILAVEVSPGQPEILEKWLYDHPEAARHWQLPGEIIKDLWDRDRVVVWKKR